MWAAIASESAMTSSASRTLQRSASRKYASAEPTPLRPLGVQPVEMHGRPDPGRLQHRHERSIRRIEHHYDVGAAEDHGMDRGDSRMGSVSSDFDRIAGRLTSSIPRYALSRWPGFRQYTTTRWPYVARRAPISSAAVSKPPYRAGTPRVPRSPTFNVGSTRSQDPTPKSEQGSPKTMSWTATRRRLAGD